MKLRITLAGILLSLFCISGLAQDVSKRWGIGIGLGLKDFENLPVDGSLDFNAMSPAIYGHVGRVLAPSWELQLSGMVPIPNFQYTATLEPINQANFHLNYRLHNGYILKSNSGFGPYLSAGVSSSFRNFQDSSFILSVPLGLGFRIQPAKIVSFHLSGHYHLAAVANRSQPQVSFQTGFTFHLGKAREIEEKPSKNDMDGDGVKDKKDQCPTVVGLKEFNGCPDSDGDGVPDKDDTCAEIPGSPNNEGCPPTDTDKDGLIYPEDLCPDEKGTVNGCPDSDMDGIADKEDLCPDEKGNRESKGCPDRDSDGVPDKEDRCPDEYGLLEYNGCSSDPSSGFMKELSSKIKFESKSDQLMPSTLVALDELADLLAEQPDKAVMLSVHTDNNGDKYQLLQLSQQRGNACKNYIVNKGISESRIMIQAYGSYLPIVDNFETGKSEANNRVEIRIKDL
ncbi:MAG: OmpA family protein [Bacteroidia bacterium]|nr:OmpA family protein [Bacteroidia bacterium]